MGATLLLVASLLLTQSGEAGARKLVLRAEAHRQAGRLSEAEALYRSALDQRRTGQIARQDAMLCLRSLAEIYSLQGRFHDALPVRQEHHAGLMKSADLLPLDVLQSAMALAELHITLDQPDQADSVLKTALAATSHQPLSVARLQASTRFAEMGDSRSAPDRHERWQTVQQQALALIQRIDQSTLPARLRPTCVRCLASCYAAQGKAQPAIDALKGQLALLKTAKASHETQSLLVEVAALHQIAKDHASAASSLQQAIAIAEELNQGPAARSRLHANLALVEEARDDQQAAQKHWNAAADLCQDAIANARTDPGLDDLYSRLAIACQKTGRRTQEARTLEQLLGLRQRTLGPQHSLTWQAKARLGGLYGDLQHFVQARAMLSEVVAWQRGRDPRNPLELAHAMQNLGVVERASGNYREAHKLVQESLEIRQRLLPANDPLLAASIYNLGSILVAGGQYTQGTSEYLRALQICQAAGDKADDLRATILLSLAIAYKSQGQLEKATQACVESMQVQQQTTAPGDLKLVPHYNTLSALHAAQGKRAEAFLLASEALAACRRHGQERSSLAATASHQLAVLHRIAGETEKAQLLWQEALAVYQQQGQRALAARTLNYLGVLAYRRADLTHAKKCFEQAVTLQEADQIVPQEHFSALCNLAALAHDAGDHQRGLNLLARAIELTELPRTQTVGAEGQRAEFFARFSAAFDMLVDWHIEQNQLDEAFLAAERARGRTFLDQLQLAGIDLRQTLDAANSQDVLQRERELSLQLHTVRMQARQISDESGNAARREELANELARLQRQYVQAWTEIRQASPLYRNLLVKDQELHSLARIQQTLLDPHTLLLVYYLGAKRSHLLLIDHERAVHYPLEVSAQAVASLRPQFNPRDLSETQRGIAGSSFSFKGELIADDPTAALTAGPATRRSVAQLVAGYLPSLITKDFQPQRAIVGTVPSEKGRPLGGATTLADVLLPAEVRSIIRQRRPEQLIVVPDGALHQLPFEALLVSDNPQPRFLLDEFPETAIAYAPSANALAKLLNRPATDPDAEFSILALGNPAYEIGSSPEGRIDPQREAFLSFGGQLARLPGTEVECARIAEVFPGASVKILSGLQATERNFVQATVGRRYLHIAAHGLVDEQHENLFGGIALTSPLSDTQSGNDGLLSLHEIESLNLSGCELAVLSACQTNVGPERPLEAGASLAQAFLAAGARRVIASHWSVADNSTADLMASFYGHLSQSLSQAKPLDYARALQQARQKIRANPRTSAPYFWAPFVLIGPGHEIADTRNQVK